MQIQQALQMMRMLKFARNPQALFNQMMTSNPQIKQVMDMVDQNGGDAEALFYKLAKENNIDPEGILSQLK